MKCKLGTAAQQFSSQHETHALQHTNLLQTFQSNVRERLWQAPLHNFIDEQRERGTETIERKWLSHQQPRL